MSVEQVAPFNLLNQKMKLNDHSAKQPGPIAREVFRNVPEKHRIAVLKLAQRYASETIYIHIRGEEMLRAVRDFKATL